MLHWNMQMAQKQGALAALQSQVAAVGRSNEGNTAQIAQLQVAMASLQTQRLDLQRADLSGRLAVLQDIAAQASLNVAAKVFTCPLSHLLRASPGPKMLLYILPAKGIHPYAVTLWQICRCGAIECVHMLLLGQKAGLQAATVVQEDLQEQLQIMRDELTQLEVDLSSRDTEAADLSRKLAHARIKLGDPTAVPPANGHARPSLPGGMRARLGKPVLWSFCSLHIRTHSL